ncbi:MAG: L-histidine N(alpha)-methyltransferase [Thioalkalivibrio sp.]
MDTLKRAAIPEGRFTCHQVKAIRPVNDLEADAREGLLSRPRSLPPKYFYDALGSELFDRICATPEYYPTRTEDALLARSAGQIIAAARPDHLIELGSGASRKTAHLLEAVEQAGLTGCHYWPFDVCEPMLRQAGERLLARHDWLRVHALVGDYLAGLQALPLPAGRRLFVFLGSTIGNFEPDQARAFLTELATCMGPDDSLLLGADRVKATPVLEAAYNDQAGITAAFNLNLLRVLNEGLDGDFDPQGFRHRAVYNHQAERIEMHLVSERDQRVHLGRLGADLELESREHILTEISRKFTPDSLTRLLNDAGFTPWAHYQPQNGYFSLIHAGLSPACHNDSL